MSNITVYRCFVLPDIAVHPDITVCMYLFYSYALVSYFSLKELEWELEIKM